MRALFGRKVKDLTELRAITQGARKAGLRGEPFIIIGEVVLEEDSFEAFAADFRKDQPWILPEDGGSNADGDIRCIRVKNRATGDTVLVSPEGYSYPRYVALEEDGHGQVFKSDPL